METVRIMFQPEFYGMPDLGSRELCDFFLLRSESAVPVELFAITSNGRRQEFLVKHDNYQLVIFLLYLAVEARSREYMITKVQRQRFVSYYGQDTVIRVASGAPTGHTLLTLLLSERAGVELKLRSGYALPDPRGRTLEEMIKFAWLCQNELEPDSHAPLIRKAIDLFLKGIPRELLTIIETDDPNVWPSRVWEERVRTMAGKLGILPTAIAA